MVACSLTVSDPVPSAMPTWPTSWSRLDPVGYLAMLTPMLAAIRMMFPVPARWARSVKAVFDDWASAFCTLIAPPGLLEITSPPSFATWNELGRALAGSVVDSMRLYGGESCGTYSVGLAFRMLVCTFMPAE